MDTRPQYEVSMGLPEQERLTPGQAGMIAGSSRRSVVRWIKEGARLRSGERLKLRAERHPNGWRTCEAWVREFLGALGNGWEDR